MKGICASRQNACDALDGAEGQEIQDPLAPRYFSVKANQTLPCSQPLTSQRVLFK